MKTESKLTAELLKALRAAMHDATVLKHADMFTTGIPDFSITMKTWLEGGQLPIMKTTWFEVKRMGQWPTTIQDAMLKRLDGWLVQIRPDGGGCVYQYYKQAPATTHDKIGLVKRIMWIAKEI